MGLFDRIAAFLDDWLSPGGMADHEPPGINPATGLPMVGGAGSVDVAGNPHGVNLSSHHDEDDWHNRFPDPGRSYLDDHQISWHVPSSSFDRGGSHDPWRDW